MTARRAVLVAVLVVVAADLGCGRRPATDAHDVKPAPSSERQDQTMTTAKLREIVAKAIANPAAYADLEISYVRGHDLSGTTHFTVNAAGDFKLDSSVTRDEQARSWSGKLPAEDRNAFLHAVESTRLLDVPSSTRNIGDDEEPIIVTVRDGQLLHEVRVWHDDAVTAGLAPFEAHVLALAKRLSAGEILTIPAR
jgi:hypothetical protein